MAFPGASSAIVRGCWLKGKALLPSRALLQNGVDDSMVPAAGQKVDVVQHHSSKNATLVEEPVVVRRTSTTVELS